MVKKSKKDKKKSKKKQISPEEAKDLLMTALSSKCNMEKEDVEKSYDDFNLKYKDGFIQKEEYIQSMKVTITVSPSSLFLSSVMFRTR